MPDTNTVTLIGNLAADPEVRILETGATLCKMRVALNDGWYDREKQEWRDKDTIYMRVVMWRELAANVGASVRRGDRVVVIGKILQRTYEVAEGDKRTITEVEAHNVALDLTRAIARATKVYRELPTAAEPGTPTPVADPEPTDSGEDPDEVEISDEELEAAGFEELARS